MREQVALKNARIAKLEKALAGAKVPVEDAAKDPVEIQPLPGNGTGNIFARLMTSEFWVDEDNAHFDDPAPVADPAGRRPLSVLTTSFTPRKRFLRS